MTGAALIGLLGGVRATVFAAIALILLVVLGVQTWRASEKQERVDLLEAQALNWEQANRDNLQAIADLRKANQAWAGVADARKKQAAKAVETVAAERDALAAELQKRRHDRGIIYRENPDAAAWGRMPVPSRVADQLRQ